MKRLSLCFAVVGVWVAATPVDATTQGQKYFPLAKGNQWTYEQVGVGKVSVVPLTRTFKVDKKSGSQYHLDSFPGFETGLWVRFVGPVLKTWNSQVQKWVPLFDFGASEGTAYSLNLSSELLNNVTMKVTSQKSYLNPLFAEGPHLAHVFVVEYAQTMSAGLSKFTFVKGLGLVHWSGFLNGGVVGGDYPLRSARVGKLRYGLVPFNQVEGGTYSSYANSVPGLKNKVLLINSPGAWKAFYKKHKPGVAIPSLSFSEKSVLVALAGERPSGGYSVVISQVKWNYPSKSVHVFVEETKPKVIVSAGLVSPYHIVVLDEKVQKISFDWSVVGIKWTFVP